MIVVVSGLPRSGTSLLMQMLAAGGLPVFTDGHRTPDASNPRGYFEDDRVRSLTRDAGWVAQAEGHAMKVVAPLLPNLPVGPHYRVLFVEREMEEVLRSQEAMLAGAGRPTARAEVLRVVFARQLAEARTWAAGNAEGVLSVNHRALIETPDESAAAIAAFVDPALDAGAMASAVDPALYRQRADG